MYIAVLFTIAKTWKLHKYPSVDEWISKMHIHIVEYYSALKSKEILTYAIRGMNLEDLMLGKRSQ